MVLAEDLRQAVLQAALQGKLTEQLETDSDVGEMLENMQKEKEILIANKKVKKEKPLPEIQEDEIPFDIPDNWRLARLGEIALYLDAGKSPDCIKENVIGDEWGVITTTAIQANNFCENENKRLPSDFVINRNIKIEQNDILITRAGPMTRTGIMCLVENIRFNLLLSDKTVRVNINNENINKKFIVDAINSPCVRLQIINMMSGMDKQQVNISQEKIRKIIIPIPPVEEQQRIVDKINEIMPKIDEYEKIEKELETLKKEFPDNMKDALLQAAMQGKLTEQLESDSSVDELLASIRKEKEKLIAQKKIKSEKPLPGIGEEEILFDIPENWRWVRLNEIGEIVGGGTPKTSQTEFWDNGDISWITPADMNGCGRYIKRGEKNITQLGLDSSSAKVFPKGSVVISSRAPIGYIAIVQNEASTSQGCKTFSAYIQELILSEYIYYAIQFRVPDMEKRATGTTFKEISGKGVGETIIPLPPIEEQQRIVERLDALLPLCEDLKKE